MGKRRIVNGYIAYWSMDRQTIYEHRVVIERLIGRRLKIKEHVHHINGDKMDNNLKNLQILSPEEHQRLHNKYLAEIKCALCQKEFSPTSAKIKFCSLKCGALNRRKVKRPSMALLKKMVAKTSRCEVARRFGVSETAVRKWLKIKM